MTAPYERRRLPAGPEAPGYWLLENRIARNMADARIDYEITMWKAIGQPKAQREDVSPDFLENYDWLRSSTGTRSVDEVAHTKATLMQIENDNLSTFAPEDSLYNYLLGLVHALDSSLPNIQDPESSQDNVEVNQATLITLLADTKADEIQHKAGRSGEDFMGRYPNWLSRLKGYMAGYEWLLRLNNDDLVANAQAEVDKWPKPSWVAPKA